MSVRPGLCGSAYIRTEAEHVTEWVCTLEPHPGQPHNWVFSEMMPRCPRTMNGYRCEVWSGHSGGCHSKALMYALAGETPPESKEELPDAKE